MGKGTKDSAVEQVMNELNQEMNTSFSSPDLFTPDLVGQQDLSPRSLPGKVGEAEGLIHFEPSKAFQKKNQRKKSKQKVELKPEKEEHLSKELLDSEDGESSSKVEFSSKAEISPKDKVDKEEKPDSESLKKLPVHQVEEAPKNVKAKALSMFESREKTQRINMPYSIGASSNQGIPMQITLKQSENLRVAQERIVALEMEIERLRKENEELIATGDIFRERLDKVIIQNENLKKAYEESREEFQDEKRTLMDTLGDQNREIEKMSFKNKELEKRLSSNIQQIRVRERELENRLELMKLDGQTLAREKDQYILDLKRQIDRIKIELDSQKNRHEEASHRLEGYRNKSRRAVRGLQMALHILRGSDISQEQPEEESEE